MNYTQEQLESIVNQADVFAQQLSKQYMNTVSAASLTPDQGYAWIEIKTVPGVNLDRTLMARNFLFIRRTRVYQQVNPGRVDTLDIQPQLVGAMASATVFKSYGFDASVHSKITNK